MESNEKKKGVLHFDGCQIEFEDGKSNLASYRILEKAPELPQKKYFAVTPCLQFGKLNNNKMSIKAMTLKTLCIASNDKVCTVLLKKSANGPWQEQKDIPVVYLPKKLNGNIILDPPTPLQVGSRESFVFVIPQDLDNVKFGISGMLYAKGSLPDGNFVAKFYLRLLEYTHCQKDVDQTKDTPILHFSSLYLKRDSRVEVTLSNKDAIESQRKAHKKKSKVTLESRATVDVSQIFENGYTINNFALNLKEQSSYICLYVHQSDENVHLLQQVNFCAPAITENSMAKKRSKKDEPSRKQPDIIEVNEDKYQLLRGSVYVHPSLIDEFQQNEKITDKFYEGYMDDMVPYKIHVKLVKSEQTKLQLGLPVYENVLKITAANTLPNNENIGFIAMEHLGKKFNLLSDYITNDSGGSVIPNKLDFKERKEIIRQIIQAFSLLGWGKEGFVDVQLSKIYYVEGQVKLLPPQASKTVKENEIATNLTSLKTTCEQVIQIAHQPNSKKLAFRHLFDTITNDASLLPSCVSEHFFFFNNSEIWQFIQNAYRQSQCHNEFPTWSFETCKEVLVTTDWRSMFEKKKDGILYYTANNTNNNMSSVYHGASGKSLLCFYRNVFTHYKDKKKINLPGSEVEKSVYEWYNDLRIYNDDDLLLRLSDKFPNFLGYIYNESKGISK